MFEKPTEGDIRTFLEKYGTNGKRMATLLAELAPEITGITTGGGWAILNEDIERWKSGAVKVLLGTATEEEVQEVKYLTKTRLPAIAKKLSVWYKGMDIITHEQKKEKKDNVR